MKNLFFTLLFGFSMVLSSATYAQNFADQPFYEGNDLGLNYSPQKSTFRIWSPVAEEVKLKLYQNGIGNNLIKELNLQKSDKGTWFLEVFEDLKGKFYTFQVKTEGKWLDETCGIYAKIVGVNGKRGMISDLKTTNPKNWDKDKKPELKNFTDIVLYEMHVRDFTIAPTSGAKNKGKFLGMVEKNTKSPDGLKTGVSHLKELGITHVHLLPSFDFRSIDEAKPNNTDYNWGYDPQNFNTPEGSYSTDAYDGTVRIREFKEMVKKMHENGIRVIMDVVYNHLGDAGDSPFQKEFPNYYFRQNDKGSFSDASGCGNETASERPMMRKYLIESLKYWATEYHIDGFRFDLMGIHDLETMNLIATELRKIDPKIYLYGEGWTAGGSPLAEEKRAIKRLTYQMPNVAAFSDDMRDGIKGHWSNEKEKGFASGKENLEESIKFGVVASTQHPQVDYQKVNYSKAAWAKEPHQCINYVSCHDNHTLFDKIQVSCEGITEAEALKINRLAQTMVFTAQGVPFLHAGEELARTKYGEHNSYKSPDRINQIDWSRKKTYCKLFEFYQKLLKFRKDHPAFRMPTNAMIQQNLQFVDTKQANLVAYTLNGAAVGDKWKRIFVVYNGNKNNRKITLPEGKEWKLVLNGENIDQNGFWKQKGGAEIEMYGTSAMIWVE